MARTRTSHPVRARAQDYAVTQKQRHAKPLVYACSRIVARAATVVVLLAATALAQPPSQPQPSGSVARGVPCLECQAFSATPEQIEPLPDRLQGTRVLVRVSASTPLDVVAA